MQSDELIIIVINDVIFYYAINGTCIICTLYLSLRSVVYVIPDLHVHPCISINC